jgi:uncharacterized protein YqgC (DUF456 family)
MNLVEPGTPAESLIARAKELILRPEPAWDVIEAEETTIEGLYRTWVMPLAAIPTICGAVGSLAFGRFQIFGIHFRHSVVGVLSRAVATYALTLACVYVLALVVDELALRFGGERSRTQAFKLAAYSGTAGWIAGVFALVPRLGGLFALLGGLYSLYLFYLGLPKLMRSDPEQTVTYFGLSLLVMIGLIILVSMLSSCVGGWGGPLSIS